MTWTRDGEATRLRADAGGATRVRCLVVATLLLLAGCARNPTRSYVAPVPKVSNPLGCVMLAATDLGYRGSQRGVGEASMKFERGYGRGARTAPDSILPLVGAGRPGDFITATRVRDALRLSVVGADASGRAIQPSKDALNDAQAIISTCISSGSAPVGP